uniref:Mitochondrial fission process protein 1 n=2 Tax=Guillardia theta TaxID=55529 RepID=A0A6U5XQ52_GUITH
MNKLIWSGRALGCLAIGGIAIALPNTSYSEGKPQLTHLEQVVQSQVSDKSKANKIIHLGLHHLEIEKLDAMFQHKDGELKLAKDTLSKEDFHSGLKLLGVQKEDEIDSLFDILQKQGQIDRNIFLASVVAASAHSEEVKLRSLFQLASKGSNAASRLSLEQVLTSLFEAALLLTDGHAFDHAKLDSLGLNKEQAVSSLVQQAINEMAGPKAKNISDLEFNAWSSRHSSCESAYSHLLHAAQGSREAHELDPTRYGGYAFLLARFAKFAQAKVRFLAFTSDVGEAMRPVVPVWMVNATYAIAIGYCVTDVAIVGYQEHKRNGNVVRAVTFQTIFQGLASIALPFAIIHTSVHACHKALKQRAPKYAQIGPTILGLAIIPFLPMVCDEPVEHLLEYAFDKAWPVEGDHHHKDD